MATQRDLQQEFGLDRAAVKAQESQRPMRPDELDVDSSHHRLYYDMEGL